MRMTQAGRAATCRQNVSISNFTRSHLYDFVQCTVPYVAAWLQARLHVVGESTCFNDGFLEIVAVCIVQ